MEVPGKRDLRLEPMIALADGPGWWIPCIVDRVPERGRLGRVLRRLVTAGATSVALPAFNVN